MSADKLDKSRSRRNFLKLSGTTLGTVAIAGCSGDENGSDGDSQDTDNNQDTDDSSGNSGGDVPVLTYASISELISELDPAYVVDLSQGQHVNIYDPLVHEDSETHAPKAHLAEEWEADGTTWTFTIRDDVQFHDGTQVTAEDIRWSLERYIKLDRAFSSFWKGSIDPDEDISAPDDTTFVIETENVYGPLLSTLVQLRAVNKELVMEEAENPEEDFGNSWLSQNEAGSGPYQLTQYTPGETVSYEFERFEDYFLGWDEESPTGATGEPFEKTRGINVPEQNTISNLFGEREALHTDYSLSPDTYDQIESQDGTKTIEDTQLMLHYAPMNTQREPMDDRWVRLAVARAFDYETAITEIEGGSYPENEAIGAVPKNLFGHNKDLDPVEHDLDAAKAAIDESSYTIDEINEIGITQHNTDPSGVRPQEHLMLQSALNDLGIETEITQTPWADYSSLFSSPETAPQIGLHNMAIKNLSPQSHCELMHHPDAMGNYQSGAWYMDDELTTLLNDARETVDREQRVELYKEAQQIIYDAHSSIYISNPPWRMATHEGVDGFTYYGLPGWEMNYHDARWNP